MIDTHKHYEMLTSLAAIGQLSNSELNDLELHTTGCTSCCEAMAEMEEISREIFMSHTRSASRIPLPAGMQQRFQERALSAGVPLSKPVAAPLSSSFLRLAFVTLLVTLCATLSWKLFVAQRTSDGAMAKADHLPPKGANLQRDRELSIANKHSPSTAPPEHRQLKRKTILQKEPATALPTESEALVSQPSFIFPQSSFSKNRHAGTFSDNTFRMPINLTRHDITSGRDLAGKKTFELVSVSGIWDPVDRERTFHYNPDLASLSFLDGPQIRKMMAIPTLNVSRSQFHLDVNKTW